MLGFVFIGMVSIVIGLGLFITADYPFYKQGVVGFTLYVSGWILGLAVM